MEAAPTQKQPQVDLWTQMLQREAIALERSRRRSLCDAMRQYLPRELRNMIYGHIVGPAGWHNDNHTIQVQASKDPYLSGRHVFTGMYNVISDIELTDYMGDETREELAEYWYNTCTFDFDTDVHLIRPFLEGNAIGSGRQALDLARRFEFGFNRTPKATFENKVRLAGALKLLKRPARLRINLHWNFGPTNFDKARLENLLEVISRLLSDLADWTVEIVIGVFTCDQRYTHLDMHPDTHSLDDRVPGYKVRLLISGNSESSLAQWMESYEQLRSELEQYYNNTLNESNEMDDEHERGEVYEQDNEYNPDDESWILGDESEGDTDDECYEQSEPSKEDVVELDNELEWCLEDEAENGVWRMKLKCMISQNLRTIRSI